MNRKWFDDWFVSYQMDGSELVVSLPYSSKKTFVKIKNGYLKKKDVLELGDIIMSAFDEIQKHYGGFKK